jgi:quinol monooxygenase YgiN
MIIEQMTLSAPEGKIKQLRSALASIIGPTKVEPGCLSCRSFHSLQEPDEFVIEANWATAEDSIRHLQSDGYKQLLLLMELGPRPPILRFYTVQETRGLDLVQQARGSSG